MGAFFMFKSVIKKHLQGGNGCESIIDDKVYDADMAELLTTCQYEGGLTD